MRSRPGSDNASADESDRYEELLVNPTLLTLARQRGEIDCGRLRYLIIRYGNFWALVLPMTRGHLAVGLELAVNPADYAEAVIDIAARHGL